MCVSAQWKYVKYQDENTSQNWENRQLLNIIQNSLKYVGQLWYVSENIKYMNGVPLYTDKVASECRKDKNHYSADDCFNKQLNMYKW